MTYPPRTPERDAEIAAELAAMRAEAAANPPPQRILKSYYQFWTDKTQDGWQYEYMCFWTDASGSREWETREFTLPWGQMADAVEIPDPNKSTALQTEAA